MARFTLAGSEVVVSGEILSKGLLYNWGWVSVFEEILYKGFPLGLVFVDVFLQAGVRW